jgi:hypothetical protein
MRRVLILLTAAAGLTACADMLGGPVIYPADLTSYSPGFAEYGARNGTFQVELRGLPLPGADPVTVAAAMQPPVWLRARPVLATSPQAGGGYRAVVVFNPARTLSGAEICRGDAPVLTPQADAAVRAAAAYCVGDRYFSQVAGTAPPVTSASDPGLRRFGTQLLNVLLPPEQPDRRPDGCARPDC